MLPAGLSSYQGPRPAPVPPRPPASRSAVVGSPVGRAGFLLEPVAVPAAGGCEPAAEPASR
eukprot:1664450-Lingulodinium_polyedra.AAC.1